MSAHLFAKGSLSTVIGDARAFTGVPFDGHTLHEQIEQTTILLQDSGINPVTGPLKADHRGLMAFTRRSSPAAVA